MAKRNQLKKLDLPEDEMRQELTATFGPQPQDWHPPDVAPVGANRVLTGRVVRVKDETVWVDVGAKSPGAVPLREWDDASAGQIVPPQPGDAVPVLVLVDDDTTGTLVLSHREALRWQRWARVAALHREGDTVRGTVTRVVRGGLLVDIGFEAFLPASQIDIRRPTNLDDYVGQSVECRILVIDAPRRSIVVTRRRLISFDHPMVDRRLMAGFAQGQVRAGIVKNIADFGAFVDLGGIDGLLHVTDMCWGRGIDPRRVVALEQRLEVILLRVDHETARIGLGLKPKAVNPAWLTPTVVRLARALEGTNLEGLPILADALEEAGCEDFALLHHLRGPDPHVCGGELIASLLANP